MKESYMNLLRRCFWSINMIMNLLASLLMSWLLYSRFSDMPTRVSIENQFESVRNLPFPAITICSPNQATLSSVQYFNKTLLYGNTTINLEEVLPQILGFYEIIENIDISRLKHLEELLVENRYTILEVLGLIPQSCDRFLKRCRYAGQIWKCSELLKPILTSRGLCCAFNSPYMYDGFRNVINPHFVNRTASAHGIGSSLVIVMDHEPENAIPGTLMAVGSVRVLYTDWSEFPADDEISFVDSGGESYHGLKATYTYCSEDVANLPPWSRQCNFGNEQKLLWFKEYRHSDCGHSCYARAVHKACHCWPHYLPDVHSDFTCKLTAIPCILKVKRNVSDWLSEDKCKCPRDCESRDYKADVILGNFNAIPHMVRSVYDGLKMNTSSNAMHFYFANPVYVKQKQETVISIISLFSNLGGVFGLFMGCSGISALEILFYIYLGLKNWICFRLLKWRQNTVAYYGYVR